MPTVLKPTTLFTIGYSGFDLAAFVDRLVQNDVEMLVDVRELPISRKPGFSKSSLTQALQKRRIDYLHLAVLGSPRALRHAVRATGNYRKFFVGVNRHLRREESREALNRVAAIAADRRSCLMCFCPDWTWCHRSCVIDALAEMSDLRVEHLSIADDRHSQRRAA